MKALAEIIGGAIAPLAPPSVRHWHGLRHTNSQESEPQRNVHMENCSNNTLEPTDLIYSSTSGTC